jgi:hypothetical protein
MTGRIGTTEARPEGSYWVVLGRNPPEIAYWERGEWWLAGDPKPWQPEAVSATGCRWRERPGGRGSQPTQFRRGRHMFRWLRGKPKQTRRHEPELISAQIGQDQPDLYESTKQMPLPQVIERISTLLETGTVPLEVLSAYLRRLYHIAYFDHDTSEGDREKAAQLAFAFKNETERLLKDDTSKLAAFQNATQVTESQIAYIGTGSLAWLIDEHHIPGSDTIPFIMRPEYGSKLGPFLEMMDPATLQNARPHIVRELIMQRHWRSYPNTVLHLHGLACSGDPATLAIFSQDEINTLTQAPYDYTAARDVLVNLGLLVAQSSALPLSPPPEEKLLQFIVSQTAIDTLKESPPEPREPVQPPEDMDGLHKIVPVSLCLHLGLTMIEALYGPEKRLVAMGGIELQFKQAAETGLLRLVGLMKNLETLAIGDKNSRFAKISVDQTMILAAWQEFGLWPNSEEEHSKIMPYTEHLLRLIGHIRIRYLFNVRAYLRYFIHEQRGKSVPDLTPEIQQELRALYAQYGSRVRAAEAAAFGEDWIGMAT